MVKCDPDMFLLFGVVWHHVIFRHIKLTCSRELTTFCDIEKRLFYSRFISSTELGMNNRSIVGYFPSNHVVCSCFSIFFGKVISQQRNLWQAEKSARKSRASITISVEKFMTHFFIFDFTIFSFYIFQKEINFFAIEASDESKNQFRIF